MARKLTNKINRPTNLWWITGLVVVLFALCGGGAVVIRSFFPAQPTLLPVVPTFGFSTPTASVVPGTATNTLLPGVSIPTSTTTATQLPTPTNSSIFSFIFPNFTQNNQPAPIPFKSATPIQAIVVTLTPTAATLPPPPPTQAAPNPLVCKNILYPARPGNQWTYFVNTPKRSGDVNIRVVTVEATQATIDATELNVGTTVRSFMQCEQDIILSFPVLSIQKLIGEVVNGSVNVDYVGGVLAPNESAFVSSNWARGGRAQGG